MKKPSRRYEQHFPMMVADVLRHDEIETRSNIDVLVNDCSSIGWGKVIRGRITDEELVSCLIILINRGLVDPAAYDPIEKVVKPFDAGPDIEDRIRNEELWFNLTRKGYNEWSAWEAPTEDDT